MHLGTKVRVDDPDVLLFRAAALLLGRGQVERHRGGRDHRVDRDLVAERLHVSVHRVRVALGAHVVAVEQVHGTAARREDAFRHLGPRNLHGRARVGEPLASVPACGPTSVHGEQDRVHDGRPPVPDGDAVVLGTRRPVDVVEAVAHVVHRGLATDAEV